MGRLGRALVARTPLALRRCVTERHVGFFWREVGFCQIAGTASRRDIGPVRAAATGAGDNVVER